MRRCPGDKSRDDIGRGVHLAAVINASGAEDGKLSRSDVDVSKIADRADLAQVLDAWGPYNSVTRNATNRPD